VRSESATPGRSAVDLAARALARRDRSETDLRRILAAKGVSDAEADDALETLRRLGAVDDERVAHGVAEALADRGYGDDAILLRLEREGIERALALTAVSELRPEAERAALLAGRRGPGPGTARWLRSRGFAADSVDHAVATVAESDAAELG
jgi:SOS response regulatory protein OraA/RecX